MESFPLGKNGHAEAIQELIEEVAYRRQGQHSPAQLMSAGNRYWVQGPKTGFLAPDAKKPPRWERSL